jgi:spore germination protein GerM
LEKKVRKKPAVKAAPKKSVKSQPPQNSGGGNGPFYVLVIIILVTVIVLLLNKFYDKGKFTLPSFKNIIQKNEYPKEKIEISKDNLIDKKTSPDSGKTKNDDKKIPLSDVKKTDPEEKIPDEIKADVEKEVTLYFLKLDEKSEKIYLSTVKRKVQDKQILLQTLEQLIKGPTAYEQGRGYITAVPSHLKIRSINVTGKTAEIDFSGVIEEGATGEILIKRIKQLVFTSTQFDNIDSIVIMINGQRRKTIGGDGLSIGGPLRR